jgi:hypothetical protein
VPEDLSVVGYDNTAFAEVFRPALTVIGQPIERMGTIAIDRILRLILSKGQTQLPPIAPLAGNAVSQKHNDEEVGDLIFPTHLVERMSTAVAPGN